MCIHAHWTGQHLALLVDIALSCGKIAASPTVFAGRPPALGPMLCHRSGLIQVKGCVFWLSADVSLNTFRNVMKHSRLAELFHADANTIPAFWQCCQNNNFFDSLRYRIQTTFLYKNVFVFKIRQEKSQMLLTQTHREIQFLMAY